MGVEVHVTKPGSGMSGLPFIANNSVVVLTSMLVQGPTPQRGQTVTVHCTGYVESTGKKFWRYDDDDDDDDDDEDDDGNDAPIITTLNALYL
jgi:hypothetical protein